MPNRRDKSEDNQGFESHCLRLKAFSNGTPSRIAGRRLSGRRDFYAGAPGSADIVRKREDKRRRERSEREREK